MRLVPFLAAGVLAVSIQAASATPLLAAASAGLAHGPSPTAVHHKPGHKGGPPKWARNDDRRSDDRVGTRSSCRTTTRTQYDAYSGSFVQRQVQVCDQY